MSRKKNCRRTPAEQAIHEEAVRLRKMTDKQLVEQFHRAAEPEMVPVPSPVTQAVPSGEGEGRNSSDIERLLEALAEGRVKGIKGATSYKVAQLAQEMGLV